MFSVAMADATRCRRCPQNAVNPNQAIARGRVLPHVMPFGGSSFSRRSSGIGLPTERHYQMFGPVTVHIHTSQLIDWLVSWTVLTASITLAALVVPGVSIRGGIFSHFVVSGTFAFVTWCVHALVAYLFGAQGVAYVYGLGFLARMLVLAALVQITSMLTQRLYVKTFVRAILMAIAVSFATLLVEWIVRRLL